MIRYLGNSKTIILDALRNHQYTLIWLHGIFNFYFFFYIFIIFDFKKILKLFIN